MRKLVALAILPVLIGTLSSAVAASGNIGTPNGIGAISSAGSPAGAQRCRWTKTSYGSIKCLSPARAAYEWNKRTSIQSNQQQKRADEETRANNDAKTSMQSTKEHKQQLKDSIKKLLDAQSGVSPRI